MQLTATRGYSTKARDIPTLTSVTVSIGARTRSVVAARDFIDETLAEARYVDPEAKLPKPPLLVTVILDRYWPADGFDRARRVLTDEHFKDRLEVAGEG